MRSVSLKKLLEQAEVDALLRGFADLVSPDAAVGIADTSGTWLAAHPSVPASSDLVERACSTRQQVWDGSASAWPIVVEDILCGAIYSKNGHQDTCTPVSRALCQALVLVIQRALAQKSLASETLGRYREINLLYRLHETIGSSLDLDEVVRCVLGESTRIIKVWGGSVLLCDDLTGTLQPYDSVGLDIATAERALIGGAFSEKILRTARSAILNDLHQHVRPEAPGGVQLAALLGAPLKAHNTVHGVIVLGRADGAGMFTAGDEKLLTALASQAGIAIANAREVEARERRLKRQIEALRIEIDETRRQREVFAITESEYFNYLQENAQEMRAEFDV